MYIKNRPSKLRKVSVNQQGPITKRKPLLLVGKLLIFWGILLIFLTTACGLNIILGSGNVVTESRDVRGFERVSFSGTGKLRLAQNGEEALTITADDNLFGFVESEVRDGTLFIGTKDRWPGFTPSQPVLFNLNVIEISELDVAGAASAEIGDLVTERLVVNVSGLSSLSMGALQAHKLDVRLSGANEVELTGMGEVAEQTIEISGSSSYRAPELRSQSVSVTIDGSGKVTVWSTSSLTISTSGKGSVDYYGNPRITHRGAGSVALSGLGKR